MEFFPSIKKIIIKLPVTKNIENNIFEGMTFRFVSKKFKQLFLFIKKVEYKVK